MAALTDARYLEFVGHQDEISPRVASGASYYKGALLVYDANGLAAQPSDAAGLYPAGIITGQYEDGDRVDEKAATTTVRARIFRGKVWLPFAGAAQTDVGKKFYIADDQTLTKTAGTKTVAIVALDFKPGYLLFDLRVTA